ncbi:hypothetical protein SS50377_20536 [Spironucleus salmonicida]|uniref:Uncharacterized protein n=1 Tax=Spironucleus salmonicida TaxID=348837 RepID=V6LGZ8_9EUKA|nr:hypothetical protein SS50377_20536 [Spironucleus salmonicida]|eukprot:EST43825.1 Hypothetical protein SS50377_16449 [Spironucleus salmonicida]
MFPRAQQIFIENRSVSPQFRANYQQRRQIETFCRQKNILTTSSPQRIITGLVLSPHTSFFKNRATSPKDLNAPSTQQARPLKKQGSMSSARLVRGQTQSRQDLCTANYLQELGAPVIQTINEHSEAHHSSVSVSGSIFQPVVEASKAIVANLLFVNQKLSSFRRRKERTAFLVRSITEQFEPKTYIVTLQDLQVWRKVQQTVTRTIGIRRNMSILKTDTEVINEQIEQLHAQHCENFLGRDFLAYIQMIRRQKRLKDKTVTKIQEIEGDVYFAFDKIFNRVMVNYMDNLYD